VRRPKGNGDGGKKWKREGIEEEGAEGGRDARRQKRMRRSEERVGGGGEGRVIREGVGWSS